MKKDSDSTKEEVHGVLGRTLFSLQRSVADRDETIKTLRSTLRRKEAETQARETEVAALRTSVQDLQGQLEAQKISAQRVMEIVSESDVGTRELLTDPAVMDDRSFNTEVSLRARDQSVTSPTEYQHLIEHVRHVVKQNLPKDAAVIVVSRGDDELLALERGRAWHFPQTADGTYASYYPAESGAAINHLEDLRAKGGQYLVFPGTAFWWFDTYRGFRDYLDINHQCVWSDDGCCIYHLVEPGVDEKQQGHSFIVSSTYDSEAFPPAKSYDVVCFPIVNWDFRFQRPQQLLTQFARDGHRVFYLSTEFHRSGDVVISQKVADNIYSIQLPGPLGLNLHRHELDQQTLGNVVRALDDFRHLSGITESVCLVDLPFWAPLAFEARGRWGWKLIYDCMDEHSGFSTNNSKMLDYEEVLIERSDLVVTTSQALFDKSARGARRIMRLPNATDFAHFSNPGSFQALTDTSGPIIGYYGAISNWFDIEMIRNAAKARPDWQFVLVGHTFGANVSWLEQLRNVHLLGEQPYQILPAFLHKFDVACIPFLVTSLTKATDPVKFYEYLSAGKPVVAVELPELVPHKDYFYPVRDPDEFIPQVEAALSERSPEKTRARIEFARQNTWFDRYQELSATILDLYKKAAIIICGGHDPDHLRLCLDRVWANTVYPNFEVVIVNNDPRPETPDYLQTVAANEPRLKILQVGGTLDVAHANNIGIDAAGACDYIFLLNEATAVTPGWLSKMIRYLEDPRLGLIGPIINCLSDKDMKLHRDLEHPDQFAEQYEREHAGELADVAALSMDCIGFRKSLLDLIGPLNERASTCELGRDFASRAREAWYRVACTREVLVHRHVDASSGGKEPAAQNCLLEEDRNRLDDRYKQNQAREALASSLAEA